MHFVNSGAKFHESMNMWSVLVIMYETLWKNAWRKGAWIAEHLIEYAVKVQRSLAPLSRFRGSHITTAHKQEYCRFQSYANSVRSPMKFTLREPHSWDPWQRTMWSRVVTSDFNSVYCKWSFICIKTWAVLLTQPLQTSSSGEIWLLDWLHVSCQ